MEIRQVHGIDCKTMVPEQLCPDKSLVQMPHCDLRVTDITSITSKVKSWLYQDQLEKPEEMILYRPILMGGLGLHHVKIKAMSSLIRTFMETAVHPSFLHSLYHTILFKTYVLLDDSISSPPPMPPFYNESFFNCIRWVKENTPLNVATMTTAQWYRVLAIEEGDHHG